jgi:hypothetical protein
LSFRFDIETKSLPAASAAPDVNVGRKLATPGMQYAAGGTTIGSPRESTAPAATGWQPEVETAVRAAVDPGGGKKKYCPAANEPGVETLPVTTRPLAGSKKITSSYEEAVTSASVGLTPTMPSSCGAVAGPGSGKVAGHAAKLGSSQPSPSLSGGIDGTDAAEAIAGGTGPRS